jgi:hypothetical protein
VACKNSDKFGGLLLVFAFLNFDYGRIISFDFMKKTFVLSLAILISIMPVQAQSTTDHETKKPEKKYQDKNLVVRIAKLQIDSVQLNEYKTALKEHAEIAVRVEPGVLTLYAVYEKKQSTSCNGF